MDSFANRIRRDLVHTDDTSHGPDFDIGVNPYNDAEELYDLFCIELDPLRDLQFLLQLGRLKPGAWNLLETLCANLIELPDHAKEIIETYPGRFSLCHIPWIGCLTDKNQPDSVIIAGDSVSMYHRAMLMNVSGRGETKP